METERSCLRATSLRASFKGFGACTVMGAILFSRAIFDHAVLGIKSPELVTASRGKAFAMKQGGGEPLANAEVHAGYTSGRRR